MKENSLAVAIAIPKLWFGMELITLVEWKAREGDWIEQGASVLVITTGKISSDVEAEASGYL